MGDQAAGALAIPSATTRSVLHVCEGGAVYRRDEVATEWPLTVVVNELELVTLVCTPTHLEDLVVGFLHSEGVVEQPEEIISLALDVEAGTMQVQVRGDVAAVRERMFARRYVASCCGKGRATVYFEGDARTAHPVASTLSVTPEACHAILAALQASSDLFRRTGGVHNACLADTREPLVVRSDIGRHNALDKVYGHCLREGLSRQDKILAFSGRVSSEVLLKVAKMGVPVVVSKSAPTELALAMAEELNVTVVGFVRQGSMNVYTHPERIALS